VTALGQPEYVLRISKLHTFPLDNWTWFVAFGAAIFFGSLVLTLALRPNNNVVYFLVAIGGGLVAFVPAFAHLHRPQNVPTYSLYPDELVIAQGEDFTIIPWIAIQEWQAADGSFRTADGQTFVLSPHVSSWSAIIGKIHQTMTRHQLPAILDTIRSGGSVTLGKFTVSTLAITCQGRTIRWEDVASIVFNMSRQAYCIQEHGALLPTWLAIGGTPNHWLLLRAITQACPPHLKKSS
jgi:hypothetical protein